MTSDVIRGREGGREGGGRQRQREMVSVTCIIVLCLKLKVREWSSMSVAISRYDGECDGVTRRLDQFNCFTL